MSQELLNIVFAVVAVLIVLGFLAVRRFWIARLNMSEDEEALERRMASLNQHQAYRRRDDEIVRLLRGDEPSIVRPDSEQDREP